MAYRNHSIIFITSGWISEALLILFFVCDAVAIKGRMYTCFPVINSQGTHLITISIVTRLIAAAFLVLFLIFFYNRWNKAKNEVIWQQRFPVIDSQGKLCLTGAILYFNANDYYKNKEPSMRKITKFIYMYLSREYSAKKHLHLYLSKWTFNSYFSHSYTLQAIAQIQVLCLHYFRDPRNGNSTIAQQSSLRALPSVIIVPF